MEECDLPACFHGLLSAFHTTQGHLPTHRDLGPLATIINQGNTPPDLATGQFVGVISSVEVSSSPMTLTCVQLTKYQPITDPKFVWT